MKVNQVDILSLIHIFSGKSDLDAGYDFNTKAGVEGENNNYRNICPDNKVY